MITMLVIMCKANLRIHESGSYFRCFVLGSYCCIACARGLIVNLCYTGIQDICISFNLKELSQIELQTLQYFKYTSTPSSSWPFTIFYLQQYCRIIVIHRANLLLQKHKISMSNLKFLSTLLLFRFRAQRLNTPLNRCKHTTVFNKFLCLLHSSSLPYHFNAQGALSQPFIFLTMQPVNADRFLRPPNKTNDPISAITVSNTLLVIARVSGKAHIFSLPSLRLGATFQVAARALRLELNCDSTRLLCLDSNGSLT